MKIWVVLRVLEFLEGEHFDSAWSTHELAAKRVNWIHEVGAQGEFIVREFLLDGFALVGWRK